MNKVCHLDIDLGVLYTTEIFGSVYPCYCGNFPNKSSFPADFRMTSNVLPGRIIWVISFVWVHPRGFYFLATLSSFVTGILTHSLLKVFFPSEVLWVIFSLPLFFYPCEDKLNMLAIPILLFLFKFSFLHLLPDTQCELGPCMSPFWMIAAECGVCTLISWVPSWTCSSWYQQGPWMWGGEEAGSSCLPLGVT